MKRRDPRMALEKVRRRGLCHPPSVSILVLFYFNRTVLFSMNEMSKKSKN